MERTFKIIGFFATVILCSCGNDAGNGPSTIDAIEKIEASTISIQGTSAVSYLYGGSSHVPIIKAHVKEMTGPVYLLVDTGAPVSVIRTASAKRSNDFSTLSNISIETSSGTVELSKTASFVIRDPECPRILLNENCSLFKKGAFHEGLLGLNAIERAVLTFRPTTNELFFHPDWQAYKRFRETTGLEGCSHVSLRGTAHLPNRRKMVDVEIEGHLASLAFDTGAIAGSAVYFSVLRKLPSFYARKRTRHPVVTIAEGGISNSISISRMAIGPFAISNTSVGIIEPGHPFYSLAEIENGVLGSNFINQFTISIDFTKNVLDICRDPINSPTVLATASLFQTSALLSPMGILETRALITDALSNNTGDLP